MVKNAKTLLFWPLLLRHRCTNPCCSTTVQFVFLVRVARYANHFSSLLGSPKIPFCRVQFLSSRTSRMRLIFCSHSAAIVQLPGLKFSCLVRSSVCSNFGQKRQNAIVQASAAHQNPMRTARARNHCELPVFLLSFVRLLLPSLEPFFLGISFCRVQFLSSRTSRIFPWL